MIKVDNGEGVGGLAEVVKKIISVNIVNLAKVDKGGGGTTLIHKMRIFLPFYGTLLKENIEG